MGGCRLVASAVAAVVGLLLIAPAAQASFHEMMIREVYPGTIANPDSGYVELQMWAGGQTFVGGQSVTVYNAGGTQIGTFTFSGNMPNGATQQTILVGDSGVSSTFGLTPDLSNAGFFLPASGGAVCWAGIYDCMAWGDFSGSVGSAVGSPADPSGIPDGMALRRTIQPGCATLLEFGDDTNDSLTDFSNVSPTPRNNSSTITETACVAPNTTINSATHANNSRTNDTANSFSFSASPQSASTSFECKLDAGAFTSCTSPHPVSVTPDSSVSGTSHTFQVRAKDANGTDATPATLQWTVDAVAPTISIDNHPTDQSPGNSVSFTYHANESVKTNPNSYECSLVHAGDTDDFSTSTCQPTGATYSNLTDGVTYTFKVRATDLAGNQSTPGSTLMTGAYTWTINDTVPDTTPPQTTILTKPSDPSDSSTASFTYSSNEPGSTFECKLDADPFTACDPGGIVYTGLQNGSHTFQVRATDPSNNTDASPAGYTFTVALPAGTPSPPPDPTIPPTLLPPQTTIGLKPPTKTQDRTPTFRFRSNQAGSTFRCKVDGGAFKACRSPFTTKTLTFGKHTLKIQAVSGGVVDPTPAAFSFKVVKH